MLVHVQSQSPVRELVLVMSAADFLSGALASHLCQCPATRESNPEDVVRDYIRPGVGLYDDDDEIAEAVEEACVLACNSAPYDYDLVETLQVTRVRLEATDIGWARQQLLGLHLVGPEMTLPPEAA